MDKRKILKEIDNFWYHYKFYVLAGAFILVVVLFLVLSGSPKKSIALNVVLIGDAGSVSQQQNVQQKATRQILGKTPSDSIIKMDFWPVSGGFQNLQNRAFQQKLMAMMSAGSLDVLVMDKKTFLLYAHDGAFQDLDQIKEKVPGASVRLPIVRTMGSDHKKHIYGIEASESRALKKAGYPAKNKVIGILANSKHPKLAIRFVKWLTGM